GPLATSVEDAALLLQVIAGPDERDSTSIPSPTPDYLKDLHNGVKGLRIGVPKEYFGKGLSADVASLVHGRLAALEKEGAKLVEISIPTLAYAVAVYYIIATAEASSNLARYDGVKFGYRTPNPGDLLDLYSKTRREGFGDEVKRRIMLGTYVLSSGYYDAYYLKALKARTLIVGDFERAWQSCDVIASPVAPTPAFPIGDKSDDPLQMYLSDIYTISLNLAGLPGISVPCGCIGSLPVGIQFIGKVLDEATLLRISWSAEQAGN
ncbi:MAG TPA: amidase family protein, partial [Verrucomicrobiota bacterium]|nr:amidase family protein [Verrucomicrobiota bacterium]